MDATKRIPLVAVGATVDPHVWLDPVLAQAQVDAIRAGLEQADPAHAAAFADNARRFSWTPSRSPAVPESPPADGDRVLRQPGAARAGPGTQRPAEPLRRPPGSPAADFVAPLDNSLEKPGPLPTQRPLVDLELR